MIVSYPFRSDEYEYSKRCTIITLAEKRPDSMKIRRNSQLKCREKVLTWNSLSPDEAESAARKIRTNLRHRNPKLTVEVEL